MLKIMLALMLAAAAAYAAAHSEKSRKPGTMDHAKAEEKPFGRAADPKKARRTISVDMSDTMRFSPAELEVRQNEIVRFVVRNSGKQMHEMVLGTMDELTKHADLMLKHPGMEHDDPWAVHVAPGKTGEFGWQFTKPGTFYYGCLISGHFEAGMLGKVIVK
jgi:uncharacterized cupredoxin-like copper-binding protein